MRPWSSLPRRLARCATPFLATLFAMALPATLAAQGLVNWTFRGPTSPIARVESGWVYDSGNQRMVLFGGYDLQFNLQNDVWEFNGAARTWANVTPAGGPTPSRRQGLAMAYDPLRQRILMFGGLGESSTMLGDTWEWSTVTKTWTALSPSPAPAPRQGSRMVYDVANDRIVLFGGWNSVNPQFFTDTWAWNPVSRTWSNINPSGNPGPRTYHGFVYNTTNNRVTIFGGRAPSADLNDLWELQGNTWVNVTPGGTLPPGRGWMGAVYESANNRLVINSGWNNTGMYDWPDTWAYNGSSWSQLPNGPLPRDSHAMAWDSARNVSVLFGGTLNDTWQLAGSTWTQLFDVRWPPTQDEHSISFDAINASGHRRIFLYGGGGPQIWETFHFGNNNGTLMWRYPWVASGGPGGRIGHAMIYDNPRDRMILFGGRQRTNGVTGATVYGDTWRFTRTPGVANPTWTSLGGGPPARYDHDMVYDAGRDRIVLFGGRNAAGTPLGDTWLFNGSSWSSAAGGPSPRFSHSMAYDAVRGVVVLFGGDNGSQKLGDTWEWNGSSWTLRAASGPPARSGAALSSYGAAAGGVLMVSGRGSGAALLDDAWIWNGAGWSGAGTPPSRPTPREGARMVYDQYEARLWLYGGLTAAGRSGEMWTGTVTPISTAISINNVSQAEGNAGTTNAVFTVSLSAASSLTVTVNYATANGTATAGADYTTTSGALTFNPGTVSLPINVPVIGDTLDETDETFFVNLSNPSGATITDSQGLGTILDDDLPPTLSVSDVSQAEGDTGLSSMIFNVTLSTASAKTISVAYATANGTATAGSDYVSASGTLTYGPGTTARTVSVSVFGDRAFEPNETFFVNLSSPSNATLLDGQGQGTITNDDAAGFTINDVAVAEGRTGPVTASFTVTLSPTSGVQTSVAYATADGSATTVGGDYNATSGTLTFPPGTALMPVTVQVNPDGFVEGAEDFTVGLSNPQGGPAVAFSPGTATILDPQGGADFNSDDKTDILWRHAVSGRNVVWYMDGINRIAGVFTNPDSLADTNWKMVGTNHFDTDGKVDILWRHGVSGKNVVWYMDGINRIAGVFTNPDSLADTNWKMVGTGDFDVDGKADILWRHGVSGKNVVWYMDGITRTGGVFTVPDSLADTNWQMVGVGDFSGDGRADILWRHGVSGKNVVWFMDDVFRTAGVFTNPDQLPDTNWRMSAVGDFNSDETPDILFRHAVSGKNVVWYMDGITRTGGVFTNPDSLPDTNWMIVGPK